MKKTISFILLFILYNSSNGLVYSQEVNNQAFFNIDSLYKLAKQIAIEGNRAEARNICYNILKNNNSHYDSWVLIGRTYSWDKQFDSAKTAFSEVLLKENSYYDAIDGLIDVNYWTSNFEDCIKQCDIGLAFHEKDINFQIKKAKALVSLQQYDKAKSLLEDISVRDPVNLEALKLIRNIKEAQMKNSISLNYTYDYFERRIYEPWQMLYLSYSRNTSLGKILGRVNWANRFNIQGLQIEADAYPRFSKSAYLYLNLGYSEKTIFPHFRSGSEFYKSWKSEFESSLGIRYLSFANSDAVIYTGSLGKYFGNYRASLRTFITPANTGASISGILITRKYFEEKENFLGFQIRYGTSPDERNRIINSADIFSLKSAALRIDYNKKIKNSWIVNLAITFENEEYVSAKFMNIYTGDITVSRLF